MRSLTTLACTLTLATGLGACTEDDPAPPPPTTAPTAPTTPAATAPVMPELGNEFSANGAATFVAYYTRLLEHAGMTGDTSELRRLSAPECEACASYAELFETTYENGGWFRDRRWKKSAVRIRFGQNPGEDSYVSMDLRLTAGSYKLTADGPQREARPVSRPVTFTARYESGWSIVGLSEDRQP